MAKNKQFEVEYKAEGKRRMQIRKAKRLNKFINPPFWKRRGRRNFTCEMGYGDCELRGYCNGDC